MISISNEEKEAGVTGSAYAFFEVMAECFCGAVLMRARSEI